MSSVLILSSIFCFSVTFVSYAIKKPLKVIFPFWFVAATSILLNSDTVFKKSSISFFIGFLSVVHLVPLEKRKDFQFFCARTALKRTQLFPPQIPPRRSIF